MAMWYVFSSVLVWTEIISAFVLRPLSGQRRFLLYNTISVNTHVRVDQGSEVLPESDMFRLLDCVSRRRSCHSTNHSWQHCLALGGGGVQERPPPLDSSMRGLVVAISAWTVIDCSKQSPPAEMIDGQCDWLWSRIKQSAMVDLVLGSSWGEV